MLSIGGQSEAKRVIYWEGQSVLCPKRVLSIYKVSRGQSEAALSTVRSNNSCYLRCLSAIWGSSGAISAAES